MKQPRPTWREPRPQLDLDDWLHAQANKLPWPGRLVRKRNRVKTATAARNGPAAVSREQCDEQDRKVPAVDSGAPDARRPGDNTPTVGEGASLDIQAGSRPSEAAA